MSVRQHRSRWRIGMAVATMGLALGFSGIAAPVAEAATKGQHVVFSGTDQLVHERWWPNAQGGWSDGIPYAAETVKAAPGAKTWGYTLNGIEHLVYRGEDNLIHELYWDGAWHNGMAMVADDTPAAGDPVGYAYGNTQHVFYRGNDNLVHELWWDSANGWQQGTIRRVPEAFEFTSDVTAWVFNNTQHVAYRATDNLIHELWWSANTGWQNGTTHLVPPPPAVGSPSSYVMGDTQHIVFRGTDNKIHELWWRADNGWQNGLTDHVANALPATSDPSGYLLSDGTQHIVYRGTDGHVRELYWSGDNGWRDGLTQLAAGAVGVRDGYRPFGYTLDDGSQHVVYVGEDGKVQEIYWYPGGPWKMGTINQAPGVNPGSDVMGFVF